MLFNKKLEDTTVQTFPLSNGTSLKIESNIYSDGVVNFQMSQINSDGTVQTIDLPDGTVPLLKLGAFLIELNKKVQTVMLQAQIAALKNRSIGSSDIIQGLNISPWEPKALPEPNKKTEDSRKANPEKKEEEKQVFDISGFLDALFTQGKEDKKDDSEDKKESTDE